MSRLTGYGAFLLPEKCILCGKPATITHGHAPAVSLDTLQSSGGSFAFQGIEMTVRDGKPCKKCGTSEWYSSGNCVLCSKEANSRWRQSNSGHPRHNNSETARESSRRWKRKNRAAVNEYNKKWSRAHPEARLQNHRRWYQANPEAVTANTQRRRTRSTSAGGSFTAGEFKALISHYGNKCLCCGRSDVKLTADHVIPVSRGGTSNIDNIQPLCKSCNSQKHDKTIDYRPESGLGRWIQRKLFG